ncbi:MAG: hypothetical protein Unbinned6224contig1001_8 [Prokaryotic dsDNA virus sp.]|nr:MAG: hypothetical protein Unbinned6224contig1001_8 [Prokaryotic dsDNA virus sp.]|tara:strand:- start:5581 stop:5970 length:390 start_codon:yes stop_codon:yes gene_type:complete
MLFKDLTSIQKGMIGENKIKNDLTSKNIECFIPLIDNRNTDIVCYIDGKFKRIQVKTVGCLKNKTSIEIKMPSYKENSLIDYVAIYYEPKNIIAYYPYNQESTINLALMKAKNSQTTKRKWFYEYEEIN